MLSITVPEKRNVSCSTMPICSRRLSCVTWRMSCPSTEMLPSCDVVEAHQQADDARLARAGRPDQGHGLSRLGDKVDVLQHRLVGLVAKMDALKGDPPLGRGQIYGVGRVDDLGLGVDQLKDALRAGQRRLELGPQPRDGLDGPVEAAAHRSYSRRSCPPSTMPRSTRPARRTRAQGPGRRCS